MILTGLKVKNFRGFLDFSTNRLSRFTLIAGENDVGKTSLLEAIFMLSGMRLMDISARINSFRHLRVVREDDLHSLFFAQESDREIYISGDFEKGVSRYLRLKSFRAKTSQFKPSADGMSEKSNVALRASFKQSYGTLQFGKEVNSGDLYFRSDSEGVLREFTQAKEPEKWRSIFITAKRMSDGFDNLRKLVVEKQESRIVQMLQRIDPAIKQLSIVGDVVYVDTGLSHLIPVQLLGDGLIKITEAFAAVLACGNGGLICFDEIDNGLHFSAMKVFWNELTRFAMENDVQIVATTHDSDFLGAAVSMDDESIRAEFTYLKLVRKLRDGSELISAYPYGYSQYASAAESGIELR